MPLSCAITALAAGTVRAVDSSRVRMVDVISVLLLVRCQHLNNERRAPAFRRFFAGVRGGWRGGPVPRPAASLGPPRLRQTPSHGPWTPAEARVWVRANGQAGSLAARRCRTSMSRRMGRMFEEVLVPDRAGLPCGRLMAVWT